MIKILANFMLAWLCITLAINSFMVMSNRERISLLKTVAYGFFTALLAFLSLIAIIILF